MLKRYGTTEYKHWAYHGAKNFKEEYKEILERFETIYIQHEEDQRRGNICRNNTSICRQ